MGVVKFRNDHAQKLVDYLWNHPKAEPFQHPIIPRGRIVKKLVDWAEYQHYESILLGTSFPEFFTRGCQIVSDGTRFVLLASDEEYFSKYLQDEILHLTQTESEALLTDLSGNHGWVSERAALRKIEILSREPPKLDHSYADSILEGEFLVSRKCLDTMTEDQKVQVCRRKIQERYGWRPKNLRKKSA